MPLAEIELVLPDLNRFDRGVLHVHAQADHRAVELHRALPMREMLLIQWPTMALAHKGHFLRARTVARAISWATLL